MLSLNTQATRRTGLSIVVLCLSIGQWGCSDCATISRTGTTFCIKSSGQGYGNILTEVRLGRHKVLKPMVLDQKRCTQQ